MVMPGRRRGDKDGEAEEGWINCGELGRGGFGVVYKQIHKDTGHYRAVKMIDKTQASTLHCFRELIVMAKLAKYPSLFVKPLGCFVGSGTLHIAMEYLEEGDLTKHTSAPLPQETVQNICKRILEGLKVMHKEGITHRDIKPANIFVVSKSPMRVKLGDFGASKWIRAPTITTLHTQVSTPLYGAPEVQALDPNSETSNYTNSVDIWSLACVIYELLTGTKLFVSMHQVLHYLFYKQPFLEEKLRQLPTSIDDAGISLLKSMLSIQPEDPPTAAEALDHVWLAGLTSRRERSGGDEGRTPPSQDESTPSRKRKNGLASGDKSKKRRSERDSPTRDDTKCILGEVGSAVNQGSQTGNPTSAESLAIRLKHQTSEPVSYDTQISYSKGLKEKGEKQACDITRTYPRSSIPNTKPIVHIPPAADIAETQIAQRSIHCKILTSSETLAVGGMLTGVLMLPGILTKILKLAGILTGIMMLARIRTRVLDKTLTRIQKLSETLTSKEIKTSDGMSISDRTHTGMGEVRLN